MAALSVAAAAADVNAELSALAADGEVVAKGEAVYRSMCFACHGMELEGAAGPNLKDAEWLHGSRPEDILRTINQGVSDKGMMAYEAVYDEATRRALVGFLLSRQEGLRGLRYEVHPPVADVEKGLPKFGEGEPLKEGEIQNALIDLSPAEMREFSMVFHGRLLVPKGGRHRIDTRLGKAQGELRIDGETVVNWNNQTKAEFDLEAGEHEFEFAFQRTSETPAPLMLGYVGPLSRMPLSLDSHQVSLSRSQEFVVTDRPRVVRTMLDGVPAESLAVGLPGALSFAIGRDGAVKSVWNGAFIDIGPTVTQRGQQLAEVPAPWFVSKRGLELTARGEAIEWRLREFQTFPDKVTFQFAAEGETLDLAAAVKEGALELDYALSGGAAMDLKLRVPDGVALEGDGEVKAGAFQPESPERFKVVLRPQRRD